jgi:hypothetical protein
MLSAVAAAIGLLFTGAVAWFSVSTARQQSAQSVRAQAARVGLWEEPTTGDRVVMVLENRSLDPVTNVELLFEEIAPFDPRYISISFANLPPCTRFIFPEGSFRKSLELLENSPLTKAPYAGTTPVAVQFYDANGNHWVRDNTGLHSKKIQYKWGVAEGHPEDLGSNVTRRPAQHCD